MLGQPRPWQAAAVQGPTRRVRVWTLDGTLNRNAWRASLESIRRCAHTFMGKPGIWYESCSFGRCVTDHPPGDPSRPCAHVLELQEPYRVSTIVDVEVTAEARVFTVHDVHDDGLWERVIRGPQLFVSPSVCPTSRGVEVGMPDDWGRPISTLTDWSALHVAFVGSPAYGPKATVVSSCEGEQCGGRTGDDTIPEFAVINSTQRLRGPGEEPGLTSIRADDSKNDVMTASLRLAARALSRK